MGQKGKPSKAENSRRKKDDDNNRKSRAEMIAAVKAMRL